MNPQTLNQLIVDRAADQMPPDVSELLDAYLTYDAPAARRLSDYRDTIALAARALRNDPSQTTVPPYPVAGIAAAERHQRALGWLRPIAIAACLALAFLTGMKWNRSVQSLDTPAVVAAVGTNNGFWAAETVRAAVLDRQSVESNKVRWSSPLRWPQTGGQS